MIGIIGAMEEEVNQLKAVMKEVTVEHRASMDFYKGLLEGQEAVVVRSGIGKVNAGICTQILADVYQVQAVINTGIAGCLPTHFSMIWTQKHSAIRRGRFQEWIHWHSRQTRS